MKLYHVDRSGAMQIKTIELFDDYALPEIPKGNEICQQIKSLYPAGITEHGCAYIFKPMESKYIESVFELVRMTKYPNCFSRFQSFFSVEAIAVKPLIAEICKQSPNYTVWEVEAEQVQKFDMHLLKGRTFAECLYYADRYWKQQGDSAPLYEYLMRPPVRIIRKLSTEEIRAL